MCFLILGQSVRLKKTKKKSQNRRPGTPASLLWSLETFFFFENGQNLGQSEDGKRKKKGDGLMD